MIRAYDDNGNIARCADCRFYNRKGVYCENERNCNRGSGNEYAFSLDIVDCALDLLSKEECDEWVCGDFERKEGKQNEMSYTLDDMMLDIQLRVPLKDIREKVRADVIDELLNKWCDETCGVNRCVDHMDRCEFGEFLLRMKGDKA